MSTSYPTSLQDLDATRGTTGQPLSTPNHITHHTTEDDTIEALQAKVGANSSAVTTSHDYKLSGVTGSDKAVSKAGTETLTAKTLTSPTLTTPILNVGSDATGDIYYRTAGGLLARLAAVEGKILKIMSGIPSWETETVTSDASTTVKGIAEEATLAEIDANTAAGGTSARLFVNPSTLGKSVDGTLADNSDAKIPSQKAVKTYVDNITSIYKNGATTYDLSTASGTQNIAHGLGKIPKYIRITAGLVGTTAWNASPIWVQAITVYNGTTQSSQSFYNENNVLTVSTSFRIGITTASSTYQTGVITFDATNIIITWTKTNGPSGTAQLLWEAFA